MRRCWILPKRSLLCICLTSLLLSGTAVSACADFCLPSGTVTIEEEAFRGLRTDRLLLPEGLREIGAAAFAESSIMNAYLPAGLETIAGDAFAGVSTPLLIETAPDSASAAYALRSGIDFRAGTVCRALLIGQTAYPGHYALKGPAKDLFTVRGLFSDAFTITVKRNLLAEEMLSAIQSVFAEADDTDISLFYYSGHGRLSEDEEENGALMGIDYASFVTPAQLRRALDAVPGRKIVLIDACYSGAFLERKLSGATAKASPTDPAVNFIAAFLPQRGLRTMTQTQLYYILASSARDELSWENDGGGVFTTSLAASRQSADRNDDGVVSLEEAFLFTSEHVMDVVSEEGLLQSVQVYPEHCCGFGLFR